MPDEKSKPDPSKSSRGTPRKTFPLRLAPELYRALQAWAEQEMRSVNGQIEYLLREAVRNKKNKD